MIVGLETSDDAAVYKINDEVALIETVDFFTPIVDDPYTFGQIAAANSLSDVYAMGGEPKIALNIVGFPNCLDPLILSDILAGGADKVVEAESLLIGGHSVQDDEPKYGLCVSGFVHPEKVWMNYGCRPGDVLILTKPVGSGIINTALKGQFAEKEAYDEAVQVMTSLNKKAKRAAEKYPITACTDITGFGLLGHCMEMATASDVLLDIKVKDVPYIAKSLEYAQMGLVPAGAYKNRQFTIGKLDAEGIEEFYLDVLYDPQSSGGLLFSVPEEYGDALMADLAAADIGTRFAMIGRVREREEAYIRLS